MGLIMRMLALVGIGLLAECAPVKPAPKAKAMVDEFVEQLSSLDAKSSLYAKHLPSGPP